MDPLDQQRLTTAFNLCDTDCSGTLSLPEVTLGLSVLKMPELQAELADGWMAGGTRPLEYAEWVACLMRHARAMSNGSKAGKLDARLNHMIDLREAFDELDTDGSGALESSEITHMFARLGLDDRIQ